MVKCRAVNAISLAALGLLGLLSMLLSMSVLGESDPHAGHHDMDHSMILDTTGMVMNQNKDKLPEDCAKISRDYEFEVIAGTDFAEPYVDTIFGFNEHQWRVEPCSRITVTFKNEDEVRHQWMIHKLPKYLYDQGMFHMEAAGGHTQVGTFIVPSDNKTYLVHCDIAQHMEKGMKAQLVVGRGSGDLWSIPGVTASFERTPTVFSGWLALGLVIIGMVVTLIIWVFTNKKSSHTG